MNEPRWLLEVAVRIAHETSLALFGGPAGVRDEGLLESALARPRQLFNHGNPDLCALAAAYVAGIVKNHPFVDGNKRTGFLAGAMFLEINGLKLNASEPDATRMVIQLAAGLASEGNLAEWFRQNTSAA